MYVCVCVCVNSEYYVLNIPVLSESLISLPEIFELVYEYSNTML
jgi:hypothetical protein